MGSTTGTLERRERAHLLRSLPTPNTQFLVNVTVNVPGYIIPVQKPDVRSTALFQVVAGLEI